MALKIRGAAEAGFKRVCIPAHRRFEGQPNGSTADLFTFAESLGVKVIPVRHVEEAFAEAHRRPKPLSASTDEDVLLDLGKDVDKLLIEHFRKCKAEFDEFYDDMPETDEERLKFDADPVNVVSGGLASRAVHAFRYGKLFEAAVIMNEAAMSAAATQALRKRYREGYLKQFPALSKPPGPMTTAYRLELAELDELQAREFKDICLASAKQVASFRGCAAIEGQIDCGLKFHSVQVVRLDLLYGLTPARDDIKTKLPNDRLEQVYASEVAVGHQVEMLRLQRDDRFGWKVALGSTMPRRGFAIDPRRLEHLLVTLSQSLNKTIERDVISCSQTDDDNEDDEAVRMARYLRTDQLFRVLQDKKQIVGFLCNECAATGEDADEGAISRVIFALVDLIANQIAVLLKYGNEADINLHDDGFKNVEFISYQLRNVRARALVGIRKCRERGVPCLGAIMSFYDGEILRDMEGKDKMLAWKAYFEADLAANVLLMAFGGESNVSS
jgi:hypothetical protein